MHITKETFEVIERARVFPDWHNMILMIEQIFDNGDICEYIQSMNEKGRKLVELTSWGMMKTPSLNINSTLTIGQKGVTRKCFILNMTILMKIMFSLNNNKKSKRKYPLYFIPP